MLTRRLKNASKGLAADERGWTLIEKNTCSEKSAFISGRIIFVRMLTHGGSEGRRGGLDLFQGYRRPRLDWRGGASFSLPAMPSGSPF
jgi:hypothetical protein